MTADQEKFVDIGRVKNNLWNSLNHLKGSECCQKNANETVNKACRIGVIIKAELINDLLKANLIRDIHLGVCNQKG